MSTETKKENKQKRKVLFFDDEPYIAEALAKSLELFGWNVKLVSDVNEISNNLKRFKPDVLIMDIMVPVPPFSEENLFSKEDIDEMEDGMNTGIVLAKKIWEIYPKLPILFLSAKSEPGYINQFITEGKKCEYRRKPELARTINVRLKQLLKPNYKK